MNKNQILGLAFLAVILFLVYMNFAEEDKLTISVGGSVVKHALIPAEVFGGFEDVDYSNVEDAYVLLPGQKVTMNVAAYNPHTSATGMYYKAWVYDDWRLIWQGEEQFLMPNEIKEWYFTYTAQQSEGVLDLYVETAVKDPFGGYGYVFDDVDTFEIITRSDAPPDPCEDVTCDSYCIGTTYYYGGYCEDGDCTYKSTQVVGKCGYILPVEEPEPTPDETPAPGEPTPEPTPDNSCEDITCPDRCVEPFTWQYDGVCVDGTCEYKEIANSADNCEYVEPTPVVSGPSSSSSGGAAPTPTPAPTEFVPRYSTIDNNVTTGGVDELFEDLPINIYGASAIGLSVLGIGAYLINARRKE